ncbi:MAG: triose-phosphate isomerase [Saprospiraceae bacterium]|nr:triose-phosphate isomerase [Saprospiraceae bacterium]
MSRLKIAAGNWKMNKELEEALDITRTLANSSRPTDVLTILGAPYPFLKSLVDQTLYVDHLDIAAQNCHHKVSGAYTGEVSVDMLDSLGVQYVIVGHSERREYFSETDDMLAEKVNLLLAKQMIPIFCCGEPLEIRKAGNHESHVGSQVSNALFHLSPEQMKEIIIAYEPIWAIGTGETASPEQAQEMHASIRDLIKDQYGSEISEMIPILYGGSVKPSNAKEIFSQPDVDGGLVGGASLKADDFLEIIHSF